MTIKVPAPSFLGFASLADIDGLSHAITTRHGGSSTRSYASLNLGFHVGDDEAVVRENRAVVAQSLGFDASKVVAMQQTHGANSHLATLQDTGRGALDWAGAIPNTDALLSDETNLPLLVLVADCAPILMVDPTHRALAVVHAGWRGAVARIASRTLQTMTDVFGTRAEELRVGIGPCLCARCFEVGDEVVAAANQIAPHAVSHHVENHAEKPHLDLRALLCEDLARHRVLDVHIETLSHCPRCDTQTFFSYRGEGGTTGRFGLYAWWS